MNFMREIFKRIFDIILSIIGIIFFSPLFIIISILILIKLGKPIFFIQERPGINGKPFKMIKFRTMKNLYDSNGKLLPDEKRITKFGKFLRSTSLDEIPELINVLKGDMSLVGPRPLLMEYLPFYNEYQFRRHEVKPGITGWAQIKGRNLLTWEEKFKLDIWYVDNWNILLDFKIILITIFKVLKREGIYDSDGNIMKPFIKCLKKED